MRINESLNLILPLYRDNGDLYAHVYSQPISASAYDVYFRLLIRTYEAMIFDGASAFSSACRYLKLAADGMAGQNETPESVYMPLLNEIERLSVVVITTKSGRETIPLQQAIMQKMLEPGDDVEALNSSVFFTAVWHVAPKAKRIATLEFGTNRSGARTSSLPLTEWIASLQTSTGTVSSGEMEPPAPPAFPDPAKTGFSITVPGNPT